MPSESAFAAFRLRAFRNFWIATLVSNLGGLIQTVGAGWMMTTITDSRSMVALVQGATTLPIMLFSLAAGALADNFDRRRIMLVAQLLMMLASVLLAAFAMMGGLTPGLLLAFTFIIGCGTALHNPSWQASMGDIVPREDLPAAVTLNSMGFNLMRSVGPAVGGIIVATAGAATAFFPCSIRCRDTPPLLPCTWISQMPPEAVLKVTNTVRKRASASALSSVNVPPGHVESLSRENTTSGFFFVVTVTVICS